MSSTDVAMKNHGQMKQVSAFSLIAACALCLLLSQNKYCGIPGTVVFFTVNTVDEILSTAHPYYEGARRLAISAGRYLNFLPR